MADVVDIESRKDGFQMGVEMVMHQGALLAMLPMEEWLESLLHGETVAMVIDPTLYRDYIYSAKPDMIKDVLRAAIAFKRTIIEAQEKVKAEPQRYL